MELRNNARVRSFLRAAVAHEEAARLLLSHCSPKAASTLCGEVIYLSGYVAECGLKSVLLSWTPDRRHAKLVESFKEPKGPGHNLQTLREFLLRSGCPIPIAIREHLHLTREFGRARCGTWRKITGMPIRWPCTLRRNGFWIGYSRIERWP